MRRFATVLTATAAILAPAASAQAPANPAAAFGAREHLQSVSLSPDGNTVAIIAASTGRGAALMIADLAAGGAPKAITHTSGDPDRLTGCDWATARRLICSVLITEDLAGQRVDFTRLIAINVDGSNLKLISARGSSEALGLMQNGGDLIDWGADSTAGTALVTRQFVPERSTGTRLAEDRVGLGVEMVDTTTLARKLVEPPRADAVEYISDGHGTVRIMGTRPRAGATGYDGSRIAYFYRQPNSRGWQKLGDLMLGAQSSSGFNPVAVDRDLNVVYGYDRVDGRQALFRIALDGSLRKELVLARPDVDVDGLVTFGRHRRVVGVSYATDRRVAEYFDPAVKATRDALGRAMRDKAISISDATTTGDKMLMFAGSDTDPGRYYLYDKAAKKLEELLPVRPQLKGITLATVKPVTYPAADGTPVPGYLTLPPGSAGRKLPAIVLPHGGPGARDEWGFDWLSQFYAARGFAVLQPNFRGSTGYGDAWFQKNGFQSWRVAVGDVNDAGKWLVREGIADPAKLAVLGWSYGGYAALQSAVLDPTLFKAIVAIAPVTDLDALREESRDYTNFPLVDAFIGRGPHVREGSPARNAAAIKAPVLLFHGTRDRNVGVGESRLMASRLKEAGGKLDYVEFPGLDHYLDDATARTTLLERSDAFLRETLGVSAK